MKTRMLGIFAVSALLGAALATTSVAQDRQRGFDGPRGEARGAVGQIRGRMRGGPRGRGAVAQPERFITRHDTDGDGQVSESEFVDERLARIDELFERRDADGDGLISAEEAARRGLRGRPGPAIRGERGRADRPQIDRDAVAACVRETIPDYAPRFDDELDTVFANGDAMLSLEEVSAAIEARAQELFARIDDDGNGYIIEDEVAAHFEAQLAVRRAVNACIREQLAG